MTLSDIRIAPVAPYSSSSDGPVLFRCERAGPWIQLGNGLGFEWNHVRLPIAALSPALRNLRILHLSDLHLRKSWPAACDALLKRIGSKPPDLILFTGDFVENKKDHSSAIPALRRLIDGCTTRLGCFGVSGNHDGRSIAKTLEGLPIRLLQHQRETISIGGATIELIGLVGFHRRDLDENWLRSIPPKEEGVPRIVLSHYPDLIKRTRHLQADLYLSGHTHGGQVCLPGGIPLLCHDSLPKRFCSGVHRYENTWMVTNRGFGFSGLPLRLFCPNEVIDIKLTPA